MLLRLIFLGILVWFASRMVRKLMAGGVDRTDRSAGAGDSVDDMVQDPVCGTYVPARDAVRREIDGRVHHFCSRRCADRFEGGGEP